MLLPEFGDDDLCFDLSKRSFVVFPTRRRTVQRVYPRLLPRLISDNSQRFTSWIIGFKFLDPDFDALVRIVLFRYIKFIGLRTMSIGAPTYLKEALGCQVPTAAFSSTPPRPQQKKLPISSNPSSSDIMPITWRTKAPMACYGCRQTKLRVKYSSYFLISNTHPICSANGSRINWGNLYLVADAQTKGSNANILSSRRKSVLTVHLRAKPATNSACKVSPITLMASLLVAWLLYLSHSSSPP
jgi:hypothetical protein